jgi:hypothetical protein
MGLIGYNDLTSLIGLISLVSLMGLIGGHISLGHTGLVGFIGLGLVSFISLVGLGCFSSWLTCERKKMWYFVNNDMLQDCFTAAILAAAARTNGVAMTSSATKITNAAIWYYCAASHWLVRESWLCYVLLPTGRLDSSFFRNTLQNAKQLFSLRLPQMTKYCIMRECENIHS